MYTGREKGGLPPPRGNPLSFRHQFPLLNTYIPNSPPTIQRIFGYTYYIYVNMTIPHQPKQVKSMWYYVFWSVATISVVLGQIYVASGYKELASALTKTLWSIT